MAALDAVLRLQVCHELCALTIDGLDQVSRAQGSLGSLAASMDPRDGEGYAEVPAAHQAEAPGRRAAQGHGVGHREPELQPELEPDTEEQIGRAHV